MDLAVERQHQRYGIFGHGIRRIGRHAHHRNAVPCRGIQIHVVETRATQCDQLHSHGGKPVDGFGISRIVHENTHDVGILRQSHIIEIQMAPVVVELESEGGIGPVERIPVVRLCSEKCYFHLYFFNVSVLTKQSFYFSRLW